LAVFSAIGAIAGAADVELRAAQLLHAHVPDPHLAAEVVLLEGEVPFVCELFSSTKSTVVLPFTLMVM
jgi:hypothetical protein